jgi:transcriptional regulator with XRE-family HTH domain
MEKLSDRLNLVMETAKIKNKARLADAAGVSPSSVTKWFKGDTKTLDIEPATRLAAVSGLNALWISCNKGAQWSPDGVTIANTESHIEDDALTIPQYETRGSMGRGLILRDQPGLIHSWKVNPEWVQKNVRSASSTGNLCIVTGFGDSMRPLYNPGDPLLVDRGVATVEFDAIYFFRVGEEGFIKRLQRIPGLGLMALSENKSYRDWTITEDMDFQLFGRVLKIWKGEDF